MEKTINDFSLGLFIWQFIVFILLSILIYWLVKFIKKLTSLINLIIILFFAFVSCDNSKNKVIFNNTTNTLIDSVTISGNPKCNQLILRQIKSKDSLISIIENCNEPNEDGSYIVKIYFENKTIEKSFGYYTNGYMYFEKVNITFNKNGEIIINEFE